MSDANKMWGGRFAGAPDKVMEAINASISFDKFGTLYGVTGRNSSDPGALYVFTPAEGRLDLFANLRPQIDETQLSETSAHSIRARDGASFRAFLTLPQGREPRNLPMLIMPHGGP